MKCLIYVDGGRGGGLTQVGSQDVPDTAADPETAAWSSFTRANADLPPGNYYVFRQGKAFARRRQQSLVSTSLGPIAAT